MHRKVSGFSFSRKCTYAFKPPIVSGVDIISVECPLCKKSIKYNKNESSDPAEQNRLVSGIWEIHYQTDCRQEAPLNNHSARPFCGATKCRTALGPSNTFKCPKCSLSICLAHRLPENHNCSEIVRNGRSKLLAVAEQKRPSTNTPRPNANNGNLSAKAKIPSIDPLNTLKGSAERRKQNLNYPAMPNVNAGGNTQPQSVRTVESTSKQNVACPFCNYENIDVKDVEEHVNIFHLGAFEASPSASGSIPPTPRPAAANPSLVEVGLLSLLFLTEKACNDEKCYYWRSRNVHGARCAFMMLLHL